MTYHIANEENSAAEAINTVREPQVRIQLCGCICLQSNVMENAPWLSIVLILLLVAVTTSIGLMLLLDVLYPNAALPDSLCPYGS